MHESAPSDSQLMIDVLPDKTEVGVAFMVTVGAPKPNTLKVEKNKIAKTKILKNKYLFDCETKLILFFIFVCILFFTKRL